MPLFDQNGGFGTNIGQAAVQQNVAGNIGNGIANGGATPLSLLPATGATGQGSFFRNPNGSFNTNNLRLGLGSIQTIGSLFSAFNQNRLANRSLALQERAFETNLNNQTATFNQALEDRIRTRFNTEGRSQAEADATIERRSL